MMFSPEPTHAEWMKIYYELRSILAEKSPRIGAEMLDFILNTPKPAEPPPPVRKRF